MVNQISMKTLPWNLSNWLAGQQQYQLYFPLNLPGRINSFPQEMPLQKSIQAGNSGGGAITSGMCQSNTS